MAAWNSRISSYLKSFDKGITSVLERSRHQTIARWEDSVKAIEASNLRKTYPGGVRALDGLGFAVEAGTIFGLLGPNGAGKSTTVKILTTLSRPDSGEARVAGLDVVRNPERVRRSIGVVGQKHGLDPEASGRENLEMQAEIYGLTGAARRERVEQLLERFGLAEAAARIAKAYSGGMQRRLDVALGLVHRPKVLFLDEPTTGLDPEARAELWHEIERLAREEEMTILLTTHYLEEADRLAARLAIVDRGRVVAEGTPEQLKSELRGDTVQVELVESSNGNALAALQSLPGLSGLSVDGRLLRARAENGAAAVPAVLAALESRAGYRSPRRRSRGPRSMTSISATPAARSSRPKPTTERRHCDPPATYLAGRPPPHPGAPAPAGLGWHLAHAARHLAAPVRGALQAHRRHPRLHRRLLHRVPHPRRRRDARPLLGLGRDGLHRGHQPRHDGPAARLADLARRAQSRQRRPVGAQPRHPEPDRHRPVAGGRRALRQRHRRGRGADRGRRVARRHLRLALERGRGADAAAGDADRDCHHGHPAADLPLHRADAAEPAPRLDPLGRQVQPGQLGGRGRPLGRRTRCRLGPDRHPRRLPRAAPARQRRLRHPRLQRLPTLRLTPAKGEPDMTIAALSWPAASIYI